MKSYHQVGFCLQICGLNPLPNFVIDTGKNFGDEGFIFLAEVLAFNQVSSIATGSEFHKFIWSFVCPAGCFPP